MTLDKPKLASELIAELQKLITKNGNLPVYYQCDYDWVWPIQYAAVEENIRIRNEPNGPFIALS